MKSRYIPLLQLIAVSFGLSVLQVATAGEKVSEIPITTDSQEALANFQAGQAALDRGDGAQANALFRAAIDKDPGFAYAWYNLGNAAFSTEEFSEAIQKAKSVSGNASEGERLLIDINLRFLDNDFQQQLALAKKLVQQYPHSPRAWVNLSGIQNNVNMFEEGRVSLKKAIELDHDFVLAYTAMANSYLFNTPKDFEKSAKHFKKAIAMEPGEDNWYVGLGDVYRAMNRLEDARENYALATMLDPNNGVALVKLGHVDSFLGNYAAARAAYDKGVETAQPANKVFYANYGTFTWVHEGKPQMAVKALKELVDATDKMEVAQNQRSGAKIFSLTNAATICLHTDMYDDAEKILGIRASVLRDDAKKVGTEEFQRIQEANIAYFNGLLAARRGEYQKALAFAQRNSDLVEAEDNPRKWENYHDLMGLIHLKQKNYGEAVEHYRQADLNVMYTKYHLALALDGAGKREEARDLFKEVADWNFNSVGYALVRKDAIARSS